MHVVALVGGDERVGRHVVRVEVGLELAQVDDVRQARRAALDVGKADKRIVLALVELVAAGMREHVAVAE